MVHDPGMVHFDIVMDDSIVLCGSMAVSSHASPLRKSPSSFFGYPEPASWGSMSQE